MSLRKLHQIRLSWVVMSLRSPGLFPHRGWIPLDDSSDVRQWYRILQPRRVTRQYASSDGCVPCQMSSVRSRSTIRLASRRLSALRTIALPGSAIAAPSW